MATYITCDYQILLANQLPSSALEQIYTWTTESFTSAIQSNKWENEPHRIRGMSLFILDFKDQLNYTQITSPGTAQMVPSVVAWSSSLRPAWLEKTFSTIWTTHLSREVLHSVMIWTICLPEKIEPAGHLGIHKNYSVVIGWCRM